MESGIHKPIPLLTTHHLNPNDSAADKCAVHMTLVHNILIRALNSIYYHAPYVRDVRDIEDYLRFVKCFVSVTELHHDTEETVIFPIWAQITQQPDFMEENTQQHDALQDGLNRLKAYITSTSATDYRSEAFCAILDDFVPLLVIHLNDEIGTLLKLRTYANEDVQRGWKAGEIAIGKHADKYEQIPFGLGCNDTTFEGGKHSFPEISWLLNVMVAWWYGRRYQGAWRFCPSDLHGRPKKPGFGPQAA
jgi:hemerythrin-like domain-containing protein